MLNHKAISLGQCTAAIFSLAANLVFSPGCGTLFAEEALDFRVPTTVPAPIDNQITPARVELGRVLFYDPRLSSSGWISCATCHHAGLGWGDGLSVGLGNGMKPLARHVPTLINVAFFSTQFWDGRADSLEAQATGAMASPGGMNQNLPEAALRIEKLAGYREMFARAYPGEQITAITIAKALATFERSIVSRNSRFDKWRAGDETAINLEAKRGFKTFTGKAKCVQCHSGFAFSDDGFHNIGIKGDDEGRFKVTPVRINKGAFKTPGLRDIARTAPYMHNGMYATLEEVIEHYDRGGDVLENLDPSMGPLQLTAQEKRDLVEFLRTLDGEPVNVTIPQLPQ